MQKLAIIGNGGGGKSTAALRISEALSIPLYSVDQIQWLPGWERNDPARVAEWQANILSSDSWIIDGWGSWELIEARFAEADLVVLVDFPLETHLAWAAQREEESQMGPLPQEPPGCKYAEIPELMRETLERVDRDYLPRLRELVSGLGSKARILKSPKEIESWVASICSPNDVK